MEQRLTLDASLDSTFGTAGQVMVAPPNSNYFPPSVRADAVAVQADGKIIVAGDNQGNTMYVTRLSSNGTTDTSFGTSGWASVTFANSAGVGVRGVMIRSDGRIVLAGTDANVSNFPATHDFLAAQLLSNGALDPSFDGDGEVTIQSGAAASAAALQTNGQLLIGGTTDIPSGGGGGGGSTAGTDFIVMRLTSTGALDTSFGSAGKVIVAFDRVTAGYDSLQAMTLDSSGKILIAGSAETAQLFGGQSNNDFAVARLTATGTLDTTFGVGGKVTVPFSTSSTEDVAHTIGILPSGQIMLAGSTTAGSGGFGIARLNANGLLDASFGTAGKLVVPFGANSQATAQTLAVQPNGAVVVAGGDGSGFAGSTAFDIARLTPAGILDTTLDGDGQLSLQFGSSNDNGALASTTQSDGKVVIAGYTQGPSFQEEFALTRLAATNVATTTPPPPPAGTLPQTINFGDAPASVVFGQTFHISPSSSSGLPIAIAATNAIVAASLAGGYDITAQSGTNPIVLTATQEGNASYATAMPVSTAVGTTRATAVVTLVGLSATFNGSPHQGSAVTTPPGLLVALAYTANGVAVAAPTSAGVYTITATIVDPNYQGMATGTLTISSGSTVQLPPSAVVAPQSGQLTFNKRKQLTTIVIAFDGDLDAASATNVANYRLALAGSKGSFDAKNAKRLGLRSIQYNASTQTVTVIVKPIALNKPLQLRIYGSQGRGLLDAAGQLIDGNRDGIGGGDENAIIRKKSISL